jgi:very-short-patch-repair endonuclease
MTGGWTRDGFPSPVGAVLQNMDVGLTDRFPFHWWAAGARFEYIEAAKHLFCKCGSAAEAFFLRPFTEMVGVTFTATAAKSGVLELIPQLVVGKHRVDFALHGPTVRLAIEVDGLSFHQRTAGQVEADYLRSRRVIARGYTVVRFTAGEAFREPAECWRQVDAIIVNRRGLAAPKDD